MNNDACTIVTNKEKVKKNIRTIIEILVGVAIAMWLTSLVQQYYVLASIPSESMYPKLEVGDRLIVDVKDFDIIPGNIYTFYKDGTLMIKRCIATGGDRVQVKQNDVYINNELLNEAYTTSYVDTEYKTIDIDVIVPEGHVFFLGDNRANSDDARFWEDKFIPVDDVHGYAKAIIFPFDRIEGLSE